MTPSRGPTARPRSPAPGERRSHRSNTCRRGRGEFGRAGVDALEHRADAKRARGAAPLLVWPVRLGQAGVGEAGAFSAAHGRLGRQAVGPQLALSLDDVARSGAGTRARWRRRRGSLDAQARRKAWATSAAGRASAKRRGAQGVLVVASPSPRSRSRRGRSGRSPARAAPSAALSAKVRPMAMTSPTDFIEVVRWARRQEISRRRSAGSW